MNALWAELAGRAGVAIGAEAEARLWRYIDLLLEANARMNLTRIADRESAASQHVADALTLLPHLPAGEHRLADVGSGGGVPGIPLAIVRPDAQVTLIEATRKKAQFLRSAAEALELVNVAVVAERAEAAGRGELRESFEIVAARALATLEWIAEWCLPLARKEGKVLAMKGPKVREGLPMAGRAIRMLGGGSPTVHPASFPGAEHHLIVEIRKIGPTDARYPRPASAAKGKPLK